MKNVFEITEFEWHYNPAMDMWTLTHDLPISHAGVSKMPIIIGIKGKRENKTFYCYGPLMRNHIETMVYLDNNQRSLDARFEIQFRIED